jgi:hypothetical protein
MKTKPWRPALIGAATVMALFASQLSAQTDKSNAAGTWKWTVTTPDGQAINASVVLKQDGEKLTGTYNSRMGENSFGETPIQEGKLKGKDVSFTVVRKINDQSFTLKYDGKLDGNQIKGSMAIADSDQKFDWNAKREPSKLDPTGAWRWSMTRSDGEKMEATMKLKLEVEKLTGNISGGEFSVEIENGRINGDEITFQTTLERDGAKFVAKSKGKLAAAQIKGTVEFETDGEKRTREWEARRE